MARGVNEGKPRLMPSSVYAYILQTTGRRQVPLCLLAALVVGMSMGPLELQRRIMDDVLGPRDVPLFLQLGAAYFALILVQGGLKYLLNLLRGVLVEDVTRRLRRTIFACIGLAPATLLAADDDRRLDGGAIASMIAAEAEEVGGFVGESISLPLLQGGTVAVLIGYLTWLNPLIAAFAVAVYLPQVLIVPPVQAAINRYARLHVRQVRRLGAAVVMRSLGERDDPSNRAAFDRVVDQAFDSRMNVYRRKFFLTFLGNYLDALGPLVIVMVGGWLVLTAGEDAGTIVVFITGFQRIAGPWDDIVNFYRTASNAQTKYALIRDSLILPPTEPPP
ncbi:MAG: hypothetical protein AB7F67_09230 [Rhodospirillaceae bacterium]